MLGQLTEPLIVGDDAAAAAVWEAEQGAADETTPTFDRIQMSPKRLAAFTEISMQVMRQSTISMENFVRGRLLQARDNALDTAALSPQSGSARFCRHQRGDSRHTAAGRRLACAA